MTPWRWQDPCLLAIVGLFGGLLPRCQPKPSETAPPSVPPAPSTTLAEAVSPDAGPPSPEPAAPAPALPAWSVAEFKPPFEKTGKAGDGQWTAISEIEQDKDAPYLLKSLVHPNSYKKWVYAVIVAIDMARVRTTLVAGTHEPTSDKVDKAQRPGLIPTIDLGALLAVFNGGFQAKHGRFGMRLGTQSFVGPRAGMCTVVLDNTGTVKVGPWERFATHEAELTSWRQTPPCLIADGTPHPDLGHKTRSRKWGRSIKKEPEIRRTALGTNGDGRTLFFALGDWIDPKALALAMASAGATQAAELDINWSYTRFLYFSPDENGQLKVSQTLVPELEYHDRGYVKRPSYRDFFYITRREP